MTSTSSVDRQSDWRRDTLYNFLYKYNNVPHVFQDFFDDPDTKKMIAEISSNLEKEAANDIPIFPLLQDVFRAFSCLNPSVIILGMDPYHNPSDRDPWIPGSAMGLAFSVLDSNNINPSLQSIQNELKAEGFNVNKRSGDLSAWSENGVMLLNSALTVREQSPGKHLPWWSSFTRKLISYLSQKYDLVWILWGAPAQTFEKYIERRELQKVIKSSHPCPLSCRKPCGNSPPFTGSGCFVKANEYLKAAGKSPIDWDIE